MFEADIFTRLVPAERKRRQAAQNTLEFLGNEEQKRLIERKQRRKERIEAFLKEKCSAGYFPESYGARRLLGSYVYSLNRFKDPYYARPALIEASKLGHIKGGTYLLDDFFVNPNTRDKDGRTALYHAIRRKRLGMAEMLLKHGAKTQWNGNEFYDAMNCACANGPDMAISLLIRYGADVNKPQKVKDWNRWHLGYKTIHVYPLAVAICHNRAKTCQILLDHGANLDLPITSKGTVRNFAENTFDDMTPDMKTVFAPILNKQITEPQKITSHPAVFPELPAPQQEHTRT